MGSVPGLGRSPGGRNGNTLHIPGKSHGQRSLLGYGAWCRKESDTTERLSTRAQPLVPELNDHLTLTPVGSRPTYIGINAEGA